MQCFEPHKLAAISAEAQLHHELIPNTRKIEFAEERFIAHVVITHSFCDFAAADHFFRFAIPDFNHRIRFIERSSLKIEPLFPCNIFNIRVIDIRQPKLLV